jgi:hypothetical protein
MKGGYWLELEAENLDRFTCQLLVSMNVITLGSRYKPEGPTRSLTSFMMSNFVLQLLDIAEDSTLSPQDYSHHHPCWKCFI